MILTLDIERLRTLDEIRAFTEGNAPVDFRLVDRNDAYELVRFRYAGLDKAGKGLVKRFLGKATGFSRAQLTRLIGQYRATGRIEDRRGRSSLARTFTIWVSIATHVRASRPTVHS